MEERRRGIEALSLRQLLRSCGTRLRWVHSHAMLADGLTKNSTLAHQLLRSFLIRGEWCLRYDERFLSARKRAAAGMDIFDPVEESDVFRARAELERRRRAAAALRGTTLEAPTTLSRSPSAPSSSTVQSEEEFSPVWKHRQEGQLTSPEIELLCNYCLAGAEPTTTERAALCLDPQSSTLCLCVPGGTCSLCNTSTWPFWLKAGGFGYSSLNHTYQST